MKITFRPTRATLGPNLEDKSYLFTKLYSDGIGPPVNVIFPETDRVSDLVSKRNYSAEWLNPLGTADWPVVQQTGG